MFLLVSVAPKNSIYIEQCRHGKWPVIFSLSFSLSLTNTLTHSLTLTLNFTVTRSLVHSLTHSYSLSHTHTHFLCRSLWHPCRHDECITAGIGTTSTIRTNLRVGTEDPSHARDGWSATIEGARCEISSFLCFPFFPPCSFFHAFFPFLCLAAAVAVAVDGCCCYFCCCCCSSLLGGGGNGRFFVSGYVWSEKRLNQGRPIAWNRAPLLREHPLLAPSPSSSCHPLVGQLPS